MTPVNFDTPLVTNLTGGSRYLKVLTSGPNDTVIGYQLGGFRPGPSVLVCGYSKVTTGVYDRLLEIPTLPWLRGTLVMITLDSLDADTISADTIPGLKTIDRTLNLPFAGTSGQQDRIVQDGYKSVLRLCAQLGMISGKGVDLRD